jgi:hypothetical protein
VFASEVGQSVRFGRDDRQNVTQRDTKRPKERTRDQVYKKRFSMGSVHNPGPPRSAIPPTGGQPWPGEEGFLSSSTASARDANGRNPHGFCVWNCDDAG